LNIEQLVPFILTICIWSLLYKENPFYRLVEHMFIGTAMGYAIVINIRNINTVTVSQIIAGNYIYILAFPLGLMVYSRFFPKSIRWLNRIPVSMAVGTSIGLSLRSTPDVYIFQQLKAQFLPLFGSGAALTDFSNIMLFVSFLFTAVYFIYTVFPSKTSLAGRGFNTAMEIGKNMLMLQFGVQFGNTVVQRAAMLIPRMQFILFDFLGLV